MFTLRRPMRSLMLLLLLPCGMGVAQAIPVTLRVLDEAKKPVAGARVQYVPTPVAKADDDDEEEIFVAEQEKIKPLEATTDDNGTLTLDLPDVELDEAARKQLAMMAARAKDGEPQTPVLASALVRAPGLARKNLVLRAGDNSVTLSAAAQMSGLVRDAQGAPLAGAKITLLRVIDKADSGYNISDFYYFGTTDFEPLETQSGADGRWVLGELPQEGIATLQASAPARVSANFRAWLEGADNAAPTQKLAVGGTLSGRLLSTKGEPVAGAQVYRSGAYSGINSTDKDGKFTLEGVPVGTQQLQVWGGKNQWFAGDEPLSATIPPTGGAVDLGDLKSGEGTLVTGTVVDKATRKPLPNLELRLENQKLKTDAQGRFEGRTGNGYLQLEILGDYVGSQNFRELPARSKTYDAGIIAVERGVSLPLDVRDEKGEPVLQTSLLFSSADGDRDYANYDGEGQTVGPLKEGNYQIEGNGSFEVIEPKSAKVPAFVEGETPKTLAIKVRRVPQQKIAGRVVDAGGAPIANATVAIKPPGDEFRYRNLSALSRRDGSWETEFAPPGPQRRGNRGGNADATPSVGEVTREGYALLRGGQVAREGQSWRAAELVMARADASLSGRVSNANGDPVAGASLSWTGAKLGDFARTDAQGNFELTGLPDAPLQLRVSDGPRLIETPELTPGEITGITLPTAAAGATDAETQWREVSANGIGGLSAFYDVLGAPRLLEAALRADQAKAKPEDADKIGPNLDAYLGMLVRHDGANAVRAGVALVADKDLKGAKGDGAAALALAAARSEDAAAKAFAMRWFEAQRDEFSMQQDGNGGVVSALRMAAVGQRLGREDAISYRDLALVWSDRVKENRAYYVDDWGALLWSAGPQFFDEVLAEWPAIDRLSALSGAVGRVESRQQGDALLERIEKLSRDPEVIKADAERAEKQRYSESIRDRALSRGRANYARALAPLDPAAALDEMEKITEGYAIQNTAIQIASDAIASNQPELARRALKLGFKDNYTNKPGASAMAILARPFDAALADELLNDVRADVLPDDPDRFGNRDYLSVANYAVALREGEPGAGRLLLEQEWARRQSEKPGPNDRWQRDNALRELARAMAVYDVNRALEWAQKAGEENNGRPDLRASIIAAALATPAQRAFTLVRDYGG